MNRYTLYCTESQTKMALELGAPIVEMPFRRVFTPDTCKKYGFIYTNNTYYVIPTAEQMIAWLEEQEGIHDTEVYKFCEHRDWQYCIFTINGGCIDGKNYCSRSEATIAAIDAALGYLINNKE